jgi:hypothetical protein
MAAKDQKPIVVVKDTSLRAGPDGFICGGLDVSLKPHFTVSEVAKFFFARSPHWVRWRQDKGYFVLDGKKVGQHRKVPKQDANGDPILDEKDQPVFEIVNGGSKGARIYTLADVEQMAYALAEREAITGSKLQQVLRLVDAQIHLWEYV